MRSVLDPRRSVVGRGLLVAVAYYVATRLSLTFRIQPEGIAALWLPSGLLLAVLLRARAREWPLLLVLAGAAGLVARVGTRLPLAAAYAAANVVEAVVASLIMRRRAHPPIRLERLREALLFALVPGLIAVPLSATLSAWAQSMGPHGPPFWSVWRLWWLGSSLGILVVAPAVLTWPGERGERPARRCRARTAEGFAVLVAPAIVGAAVFLRAPTEAYFGPLMSLVAFPLFVWAGLRFGPAGASVASLAFSVVAVAATVHGLGPFAAIAGTPTQRVWWLESFLGASAYAALMLAAADTESKRALRALGESETKYRSIFENAVDGIFRTTAAGELLEANPATARMLGYASLDALRAAAGSAPIQVFARPSERAALLELLAEREAVPAFEHQVQRHDGTTGWASLSARAVRDAHGRLLYIEGIAEDIAARKHAEAERERLEAQLRRAQKLEALGTLAGGIAHDFNNILAAIVGNLEFLKERLELAHPARELVGEIAAATDRATELVGQILAFSRQRERARQPIDVGPVVNEVARLLRAVVPTSIEIQAWTSADLPSVLADPSQIHQVLMNLATNAVHAMRGRAGALDIDVRVVAVGDEPSAAGADLRPGRYVRLAVSDTGHGMDPATLARIFEPFYTTKSSDEGTGLGLAVVQGIVRNHDGGIAVRTTPGQGTVFHVYFPALRDARAERAPDHSGRIPRGRGERVLIVDDEATLARVVAGLLGRLGYAVVAYTSPEDAVAAFRATPGRFDAVITDLRMPRMSGLELGGTLLAIRPDVPILLATGFAGELSGGAIRARGFRDLLLKPYSVEELGGALRSALARSR